MAAAATLALAACGFTPRAPVRLPAGVDAVRLTGVSRSDPYAQQVERELLAAGIRVPDDDTSASPATRRDDTQMLVLRLVPIAYDRRDVRLTSGGRVSEFEWTGRAEAEVSGAGFDEPRTLGPVRTQRRYTFSPELVLAQGNLDERLRAAIARDLAGAIVRRLELALSDALPDAASSATPTP